MSYIALPSSFAQQRLWFLDQMAPGNAFYNLPMAVPIDTALDVRAMRLAINEIVRRHESLRTTFRTIDGEPKQIIAPERLQDVPLVDLNGLPGQARVTEATRLATVEAARPFDLEQGPLLRTQIVRLSPTRHVLLVTMHHIVSDAWSMGIFWKELTILYGAAASGRRPPLPELPIQYADYAAWQQERLRGEEIDRLINYWTNQLTGMPSLDLPCDHPRRPVLTYSGSTTTFTIDGIGEDLDQLAIRCDATAFMVLLAAFVALLQRYTDQDDTVVGVPISNRTRAEVEPLIGFFVNSLVFRIRAPAGTTFTELVEEVRRVSLDAFAHQELPFERLVSELAVERDLSRNPLFQATFQHLDDQPGAMHSIRNGSSHGLLDIRRGTSIFDLAMTTRRVGGSIVGRVEYNTDLFEPATSERWVTHFVDIVRAAVSDPGRPIRDLVMMSDAERSEVLASALGPVVERPSSLCLHDLVTEVAGEHPHRVALRFGGSDVTYGELMADVHQVSSALRAHGAGRGAVVGVMMERSPRMVAAIIGVLEAGAAYLPLDPSEHPVRMATILAAASPTLVLVDGNDSEAFVLADQHRTLAMDRLNHEPEALPPADAGAGPDDLAYVIFTSGSTGTPKGVAMPHRAAVNQVCWMRDAYTFGPDDVLLHKTPIGFDASIWELFVPLSSGGRIVIADPGGHRDVRYLARVIAGEAVTSIQLIPSQLELLLDEPSISRCTSLRRVFAGGEPLPSSIAEYCLESLDVELHNLYGPTEACVQTVVHTCERNRDGSVASDGWTEPIGRPIDNISAYVLDPSMGLVPDGVCGELYLGGVCLARGYLGQPSETARRFLPDPYSSVPGARLYRTGDIVCRRPDGTLRFIGRRDHQVKVRGHRIELGEIEAVLRQHENVAEAVVLHRRLVDDDDDADLVAYVTAPTGGSVSEIELRSYIADRLPSHLVPRAYVFLPELPHLSSGKVDRNALPAPGRGRRAEPAPPRDAVDELMVTLWSDVLGQPPVGIDDHFFNDLQGHSLLATRLVTRVRETFRTDIPLALVFEHSTVRTFTDALRSDPEHGEGMERIAEVLVQVAGYSDDEVSRLLGAI